MCMSPSQLLLATHTQLSSVLAPINNATYVYIDGIHMVIYTYAYIVKKTAVPAHSAALSRP